MPRRRPVLTLAVAASLTGGGAVPAIASAPATEVRVGQASDFTRIEFRGAQPVAVSKDGHDVVLRFGRIAPPDLARLRATPPRFLAGAESSVSASGVEVRLSLAEKVSATLGRADGAAFVNLAPETEAKTGERQPAAPEPSELPQDSAPERRGVDPVPPSGVIKMRPQLNGRTLRLDFAWAAPVGAAVFRRGEAIWVVFDAKARLDLSKAPQGLAQLKTVQAVEGGSATALRLIAPSNMNASVSAEGATWSLTLAPGLPSGAEPVPVSRDAAAGGLRASLAGATGVFWLRDPAVGDRLAVVTARGPAKGIAARQAFVEAALLPSAQGLAIEPTADDLTVAASADVVSIGRPHGLALSAADAHASSSLGEPASSTPLPQAAELPGLVPFDSWRQTGPAGFLSRYDALSAAASEEAEQGPGAPAAARMGLARFLVGSELAYEAIGVLQLVAKADPKLVDSPAFRGLRGAARAIVGRSKDAEADFSAPSVAGDPASALWRGYALAKTQDWTGAQAAFASGRSALKLFTPRWQARFARAQADAALATNDLETARLALTEAPGSDIDPSDLQGLTLARARLAEASGQRDEALRLYQSVQGGAYGAVAAPAALHAVQLKLAANAMPLAEALKSLDSLRFRWRGDGTELEVVRALSGLYLGQGRYREALESLRSAGRRLPDLPAAAELQADLAGAFKSLFLDGVADGLQPIQALALFDDFRELTPIGADGDRMVRRLAKRLVDVDLLDQAAALLKYQVENRLDGVPKAEVSADLAAVYLMARQPEAALQAINSSRSTLLPNALNAERRTLEARALVALGRYDHAIELIGADRSPEALEVRGDAAWAMNNWAQAGASLEAGLGERWKAGAPLTPEDERKLLRAGIAYSLAQDDKALARLRARWGRSASGGRTPDAMRVALTGMGGTPALTPADLARAAAETDAFAGWISRAKARFLAKDEPAGPPRARS